MSVWIMTGGGAFSSIDCGHVRGFWTRGRFVMGFFIKGIFNGCVCW